MRKGRITCCVVLAVALALCCTGRGALLNVTTIEELEAALSICETNEQADTINLNAGTYSLADVGYSALSYTPASSPVENYSLTIQCTNGTALINAEGSDQCLSIDTLVSGEDTSDADIVIKNVKFVRGFISTTSKVGGGLYVRTQNSDVLVDTCSFVSNRAAHIYQDPNGGGAFVKAGGSGTATVKNSTFFWNSADGVGGGLYVVGGGSGSAEIFQNTMVNNQASMQGGGCYISAGANVSFQNNALVCNTNKGWASDCTGGGLHMRSYLDSYEVDIFNNVFFENDTESGTGNDLYLENDGDDNSTGSVVKVSNNNYSSLDYDTADNLTIANNINGDPQFLAAASYDFHLNTNSPCINSGTNQDWMTGVTDIDGDKRIIGGVVDIGIDESAYDILCVTMTSTEPDPTTNSPIPVTVVFSENVLGFTNTDITAGNASVEDFLTVSASNYTFNLVPSGQGQVTADIAAGVCQEAGGNSNAAAQFSRVYDSVAPSVAMSSAAPDPTRDSPIPVTVVFTENVLGFTNTDITAGNGSVEDFLTVSASNYTFNLVPSGQGEVTANIAAGACADSAANTNTVAAQLSRVYDSAAPTIAMSSAAPDPTRNSPIAVTVIFSENVLGFTNTDITAGNGSVEDFLTVSASNYTFSLAPSGQGEVTADIAAGACVDSAANTNTVAAQLSRVYDSAAPTIAMSSAAPDPTKDSPIAVTVSFSENVLGFTNTDILAGNASVSDFLTVSASNYTFNLVPSGQGEVTADIAAGTCVDSAGNTNTAAAQFSRVYDSLCPTPNPLTWQTEPAALSSSSIRMRADAAADDNPPIEYLFANLTAETDSGWQCGTGWTNNGLSANSQYGFRVKARDAAQNEAVWSSTNYAYTHANVPLSPIVTVPDAHCALLTLNAANTAGIYNADGNPSNTQYAVGIYTNSGSTNYLNFVGGRTNNPLWGVFTDWGGTNGLVVTNLDHAVTNTFMVKARNYDSVATEFGQSSNAVFEPQLAVNNALQTNDGSGLVAIDVTLANPEKNDCFLQVAYGYNSQGTGSATNAAWLTTNILAEYGAPSVDNSATNQIIDIPTTDFTNTVSFSWDTRSDNNSPALTGMETNVWLAVRLYEPAGGFTGATHFTNVMIDNKQPTAVLNTIASNPTKDSPIPVTVTFSEPITGFTNTDISVANAVVENFATVNASNYTFDLTPSGQGEVTADIDAGVCRDTAGNDNEAAVTLSRVYDNVAPSVSMSSTTSDPTEDSQIPVTVIFSEHVTGFASTDISAGNGTVEDFATVNASNYTFNLTVSTEGTVTANIAAGVCQDAAGNENGAALQLSRLYEVSAVTNDPPPTEDTDIASPSGVSASDGTYTDKIRVTWSAVSDATSYEVWRGVEGTSKGRKGSDRIAEMDTTEYDDMSAAVGTTYYYWVKAKDDANTSEFSSSDSGWRRSAASADNAEADFDGDGFADMAVYHEASGYWYVYASGSGSVSAQKFGEPGYSPVPGDYDGDGQTDLAVYHEESGYWFMLPSSTGSMTFQKLGAQGYEPVTGDYDGDGQTDLAVYHEELGYWFIILSASSEFSYQKFGQAGYAPVFGDFDGDGKTDLSVYHEASGYWFVLLSTSFGLSYQKFGEPGYDPVPADYDGDGKTDLAVYHETSGYWYVLLSGSSYSLFYQKFGEPGYDPIPADYDGDGKADLAVYHEISGYWFVLLSGNGTMSYLKFGGPGYVPVSVIW